MSFLSCIKAEVAIGYIEVVFAGEHGEHGADQWPVVVKVAGYNYLYADAPTLLNARDQVRQLVRELTGDSDDDIELADPVRLCATCRTPVFERPGGGWSHSAPIQERRGCIDPTPALVGMDAELAGLLDPPDREEMA